VANLNNAHPEVKYDLESNTIQISDNGGPTETVSPAELRRACRCAACVEELTGRPLLDPDSVPENIFPTEMVSGREWP